MNKISRKKTIPAPTKFSGRDKAALIGIPVALFAIIVLLLHVVATAQQNASVTRTVTKWKTTYHINDEQAARIKQIELDFHGNGSPFSFGPTFTPEDEHSHHEQISRLMAPEDGARFMKAMERSEGKH
ncbi:MAG TPA: hypothetical protein P5016_02375 [Verrucomicrobiales bacterium]|nr:hypothetical protein [Verrucomicrobiales bacterium]